uniref:Cdk-activating kinase assembly factor MAT1 centre domain-containing protein n=1 Tax=Ditylenchus dipsaci TaxID=166011 RepID=A0A915ECH5_9BILA
MIKVYNLQEDDFSCLREYNDYLEHFEDLIFKLVQEIDVEEVEAEMKQFRDQNVEKIERNRRRLNPDEIWINEMLGEETNRSKRLKPNTVRITRFKWQSIHRLSSMNFDKVTCRLKWFLIEETDKAERRCRGQDIASFVLPLHGPKMPTSEEIESRGYLEHVRQTSAAALAGGYFSQIGCTRAIFEDSLVKYEFMSNICLVCCSLVLWTRIKLWDLCLLLMVVGC